MIRAEAINYLKEQLETYLMETGRLKGKSKNELFNCVNPDHNDSDPSMGLDRKNNQCHCFGCQARYDIFDMIGIDNNIPLTADTFPMRLKLVADYFKIDLENENLPKKPKKSKPVKEISKTDYSAFFKDCKENLLKSAEAVEYLNKRKLDVETAYIYGIGYCSDWQSPAAIKDGKTPPKTPRLIIPTSQYSYLARDIREGLTEEQKKWVKMKEGEVNIFNLSALYNKNNSPVFIVEGEIDALSILQNQSEAIALGGLSNIDKLVNILKENPSDNILILSLDNDVEGRKASKALEERLFNLNTSFITYNISGDFKDANEALVKNSRSFKKALIDAERSATKENFDGLLEWNAGDYLLQNNYATDIAYFQKYKDRKMGYEDIDKYLTLYPGLVAFGGASSIGKTTFMINVVDNLIKRGEKVIYFSLEQLPIEIITKLISKRLYEKNPSTKLTNVDIKSGISCSELEKVKKDCIEDAKNLNIVAGNFKVTAKDIISYVERFIKKNGGKACKPVVIIDYLQLLSYPKGFNGGIREAIDENVKALKDMQKNNELFVVMISSFNRSTNYEPVGYENFKETSMIEFTCDYVWGLQLSILDTENEDFYRVSNTKGGRYETAREEKKKSIEDAQNIIPKEVEFVSLKNRNGKQRFKAFFKYYPQYDCFVPKDEAHSRWKKIN